VLIVPINWWYRRQGRTAYGLTRAGRPWITLILAGVRNRCPHAMASFASHPVGKQQVNRA
jgi:hypothetical protein